MRQIFTALDSTDLDSVEYNVMVEWIEWNELDWIDAFNQTERSFFLDYTYEYVLGLSYGVPAIALWAVEKKGHTNFEDEKLPGNWYVT